jgi:hypothetical protein
MFEVFRGWRDIVGSMGRQTDDCNRGKVSDEKRCHRYLHHYSTQFWNYAARTGEKLFPTSR